jgi:hypothetical protein
MIFKHNRFWHLSVSHALNTLIGKDRHKLQQLNYLDINLCKLYHLDIKVNKLYYLDMRTSLEVIRTTPLLLAQAPCGEALHPGSL